MQSKARLYSFLDFPEIHQRLLKRVQVVKVGGLGDTQDVTGCWQNFPARSPIYLAFCQKGEKTLYFWDRLRLWTPIWHHLLTKYCTYRQARGRSQTVPLRALGTHCGWQCLRTSPVSPVSWYWALMSLPPLECGRDLGAHFSWIEYSKRYGLSLLRLGYKKTVASVFLSLFHSVRALILEEASRHVCKQITAPMERPTRSGMHGSSQQSVRTQDLPPVTCVNLEMNHPYSSLEMMITAANLLIAA